MLGGRSSAELVARYADSHSNPVNRACHSFGIPMIAASVPMFLVLPFLPRFWALPVTLFSVGWALQFTGHAFEGKKPEFLTDWRFLFVGLRWWFAKMRGRA